MESRCPNCGRDGLVPVTGALLNDSYQIASHFTPFAALHIIIAVAEEEQENEELYLVCRYCGFLKPLSPYSKEFKNLIPPPLPPEEE